MRQSAIFTVIAIICTSLAFGQSSQEHPQNGIANHKQQNLQELSDSAYFFFPPKVFGNFFNEWYSKHLHAMEEPFLYTDKSNKEIYRFTWLRTFHNPIAIRIEKSGNDYSIYWKLCNGAGGYDPGKLIINGERSLDKIEWDNFIVELNKIDFWNLRSNWLSGEDGSEWILEGKTSVKYHAITNHSPDKGSKYYNCCNYLITLTELIIDEENKY